MIVRRGNNVEHLFVRKASVQHGKQQQDVLYKILVSRPAFNGKSVMKNWRGFRTKFSCSSHCQKTEVRDVTLLLLSTEGYWKILLVFNATWFSAEVQYHLDGCQRIQGLRCKPIASGGNYNMVRIYEPRNILFRVRRWYVHF
jgi:hypothetical protein